MKELHEKEITNTNIQPKDGQRDFLCSNNLVNRCPSLDFHESFSNETIEAFKSLGEVLMSIRKRMIAEGYEIKDGQIYKRYKKEYENK